MNREFELKRLTELVKSGLETQNEGRASLGLTPHPDGDTLPNPIGTGGKEKPQATEATPSVSQEPEAEPVETDGGTPEEPPRK